MGILQRDVATVIMCVNTIRTLYWLMSKMLVIGSFGGTPKLTKGTCDIYHVPPQQLKLCLVRVGT